MVHSFQEKVQLTDHAYSTIISARPPVLVSIGLALYAGVEMPHFPSYWAGWHALQGRVRPGKNGAVTPHPRSRQARLLDTTRSSFAWLSPLRLGCTSDVVASAKTYSHSGAFFCVTPPPLLGLFLST